MSPGFSVLSSEFFKNFKPGTWRSILMSPGFQFLVLSSQF
jgi:hypothetical protein